jgi:hypothetical protein
MKRTVNIAFILCTAGLMSYAANWNAKLLDASCAASNPSGQKTSSEKFAQTCAPTATTSSFAIESAGKIYKLDTAGNNMAAAALKNGSITPDKDGDVHATVQGNAQGDMIQVESISGRGGAKHKD